jgi:hypothetical protein
MIKANGMLTDCTNWPLFSCFPNDALPLNEDDILLILANAFSSNFKPKLKEGCLTGPCVHKEWLKKFKPGVLPNVYIAA